MRSNKRPNRFSPLAMHLFTRYLLSLAALFAAVVGGYFFAAFVCPFSAVSFSNNFTT